MTAESRADRGWLGPMHHVAIAVPSLAPAAENIRALVGGTISDSGEDADLAVDWVWITAPGSPIIELLSPKAGQGPIARWLERRGAGLHHVSFMPTDLEQSLDHGHRCGLSIIAEDRSHSEYEQFYVDPKATGGALFHAFRFLKQSAFQDPSG